MLNLQCNWVQPCVLANATRAPCFSRSDPVWNPAHVFPWFFSLLDDLSWDGCHNLGSYALKFSEAPFAWIPSVYGTPLQYSCLENPMDGGAWWAAVHGVAKSPTRLSDFTFTFHFHALEKEMATHSSILAWKIPGTAEPGRLLSLGSHRVRQDWRDLAAAAAASIYLEKSCIYLAD